MESEGRTNVQVPVYFIVDLPVCLDLCRLLCGAERRKNMLAPCDSRKNAIWFRRATMMLRTQICAGGAQQ
jgi:hypothetical protein